VRIVRKECPQWPIGSKIGATWFLTGRESVFRVGTALLALSYDNLSSQPVTVFRLKCPDHVGHRAGACVKMWR
jgi:hypothetical protein